MDIPLQGSLRSFKFPDVLTLLSLCQRAGTLELDGGGGKKASLFFNDGRVIHAISNQPRLRLSSVMHRQGLLDRATWDRLEKRMLELGERFGRVAVEEGVITGEQLQQLLKVQVSEIVYDCFTWGDGTFSFLDELAFPEHAVTISIDTSNLIMEGARRIDEWQECQQLFPDPEVVFRVEPAPAVADRIVLTLTEWKILFLMDGTRTLREVTEAAELEPLEVYRVVYGLLSNKLIEKRARPELPVATLADEPGRRTLAPEAGGATPVPASPAPASPAPAPSTASSFAPTAPSTAPTAPLLADTHLLVSPEARFQKADVLSAARLVSESADKREFPLLSDECTIGRTSHNSIRLTDPGISGAHARIRRRAEGDLLEDLGSKNGCYVNGNRVERKLLQDGDRLRFSNTVLVYRVGVTDPGRPGSSPA